MGWIITNKWDSGIGWNDTEKDWSYSNYDTFDDDDRKSMDLPEDGLWEQVPWNKEA